VPEGQALSLSRLIRAAGLRWPAEENFQHGRAASGWTSPSSAATPRSPGTPCWSWPPWPSSEQLKANALYALYVLALCLGLRRGELLGLRWDDIDLDTGTLEVVQTLQRVGGALRFVRPKTERSARTVPLPPLCIDALREHRRQQFASRADAWPDWQENGLVFPTRIGTPMEPDNLRRSWGRIRTSTGLTGTRFHDMRH
jgi:integrase